MNKQMMTVKITAANGEATYTVMTVEEALEAKRENLAAELIPHEAEGECRGYNPTAMFE